MSTQNSIFGEVFLDAIRQAVREEIQVAVNGHKESGLLTPEELGDKLKIPVSWVYEQSRQNKIPTHRLGRYIRFDLREVLESQKTNRKSPAAHCRLWAAMKGEFHVRQLLFELPVSMRVRCRARAIGHAVLWARCLSAMR